MIKLAKNDEANKLLLKFKKIEKTLENAELVCAKTDRKNMTLIGFFCPLKFIEKIHYYEITLDEAINDQKELDILINKLNNNSNPRNPEKVEKEKRVLESAEELQNVKKMLLIFLKKEFLRIKVKHLK